MQVVPVTEALLPAVAPLVAAFRVTLKGYKGIVSRPDPAAGAAELQEYLDAGFPCFAAMADEEALGYLVCRVDEPCVWVESIYTTETARRQGVATALLHQAEAVAQSYGEETVFHYVHPNNHGMIAFLRKHGYTVLNLIEIRKPYKGETLTTKIQVGGQEFDY